MKKLKLLFLVPLLFLTYLFAIDYSNCLNIVVKPIKEKINISNYAEFAFIMQNNCNKDLKISFKYPGYVYNVVFDPMELNLKKGDTSLVNLKIYPPYYLYSGWKALKINIYEKESDKKQLIKQELLKFYIFPTPKEIEKKVEYEYIILTKNLDLNIIAPPKLKSGLNGKTPFKILLKGINKSELKDFSLTVFINPLENYDKNKFKPLKLEWDYLSSLDNKYVSETKEGIVFKNFFLNNLDVAPTIYKINVVFNLRKENKFDLSEEANTNIILEGTPYFKTEKQCFSNFYKKECVYKITNIGNAKGVYELNIPLSFLSRIFVSFDFPAKIEDGKIVKSVVINAKESKRFVVEFNYLILYILALVIIIALGIYFYLFYVNPISIRKEIQKIEISKNKRSFHIEIILKNNTFKPIKDIVIIEKMSNNANLSELSIYPRPDKVKEDLNTKTIRWEVKELKPFSSKVFKYKIIPKDKSIVIIQPTVVKFSNKLFKGNGLKISLKEEINVKEF